MKFTPLTWISDPKIFGRIVLSIVLLSLLCVLFFKIVHSIGFSDGASQMASDHTREIRHAAERENHIVKRLSVTDLAARPISPGNYTLEIHSSSGVDSRRVSISKTDGRFYMTHGGSRSPVTEEISMDGVFFDWQSVDYDFEHFIGRNIDGEVIGRVFHARYGSAAGMDHFTLKLWTASKASKSQ